MVSFEKGLNKWFWGGASMVSFNRWSVLSVLIALTVLTACKQEGGPQVGTPFIGGQKGVDISFEVNAPPKETFDGGKSPFDVAVRLRNVGEFSLSKDKVKVSIAGIQPEEFGKVLSDFSKSPSEDLEARRKDSQGNIVESNIVVTSFDGLNHKQPITGAALTFPIRADVCYRYGTIAATQLCSRSDILNPRIGGVCEVSGSKQVYNSGAPIQVEELMESPRSQNQVGFTFRIKQVDESGKLFQRGTNCDASQRRFEDKVFVDVRSYVGSVSCSGLFEGTAPNNGYVQLFDKSKTVTCVQELKDRADSTFPVTIDVSYDFRNEVNSQIIVKHVEG